MPKKVGFSLFLSQEKSVFKGVICELKARNNSFDVSSKASSYCVALNMISTEVSMLTG